MAGYGDDIRRTGESKVLHPLRVFLRLSAEQIPPVTARDRFIVATSMLAAILHDAKEDFAHYSMTYSKQEKKCRIVFLGKDKMNHKFDFELTFEEYDLLELQIEALTMPKKGEDFPPEEKARLQFSHLSEVVKRIQSKYGNLAAYYTLRIKDDDRIDNLCTYWEHTSLGPVMKNSLNKITETILFFRDIEKDMINALAAEYRQHVLAAYPHLHRVLQLSVELGELMLVGASYNELFTPVISSVMPLIRDMTADARSKGGNFPSKQFFIIPLVAPSGGYLIA